MARDRLYPPSVTPGIPKPGKMPDGWIEATFGDVLKVAKRPADIQDDRQYQLVTAKRNRGGIVAREVLTGRQILTKTQFYLRQDDFVISKRQIIHGACGIVPAEFDGAVVSNEYSVLRVREGLLLEYLNYLTHTVYFQQTCFQSSVGVDVEKMIFDLGEWLSYKVYLPPLPEQHRIATLLGTWDAAIATTEQLIAAKQKQKKGLMQVLLTGKLRSHNCRSLGWTESRFDEIFEMSSGSTPSRARSDYFEGDFPWITSGELNYGIILDSKERISEEAIRSANLKIFPKGSFVIAITGLEAAGTRGRCGILGMPATVSQSCMVFSTSPKVDTYFLFYYYLLFGDKIAFGLAQGTKQQSLPRKILSLARITYPLAMDEQKSIVEVLRACDVELGLLARKLTALRQEKKGLLQQLLTGKIRLKVS